MGRFIKECCVQGVNEYVTSAEFYDTLSAWAENKGYREMTHNEVGRAITTQGYQIKQKRVGSGNVRCVLGLSIGNVADVADVTLTSTHPHAYREQVKSSVTSVTSVTQRLEAFSLPNSENNTIVGSEEIMEPCKHGFYVDEDCLFCRQEQEKGGGEE